MTRRIVLPCLLLAVIAQTTSHAARQATSLAIVSHAPTGEIAQLADANDVRIMFSEPMIAIGSSAVVGQPSWITMTPAQNGHWFWSGTRTLIFSPDPDTPFPYATRYTVRMSAATVSLTGHTLASPDEFDFTTPTVRLLQTQWYRKNGRFDDPVVLMLRFNQPVRPADVAAHAHVSLAPHSWTPPVLQPEARARLERTDPAGLARFDAKVAAIDRIARANDPVAMRVAESWDEKRYNWQKAPDRVVLETVAAPPPEARLAIEIDDTMPSPGGPATHAAQSSQQSLDRAFFIDKFACVADCDPSGFNVLPFRAATRASALAGAVEVRDVTGAGAEVTVAPAAPPPSPDQAVSLLSQLGFTRQPPMTTWAVRIDSSLQSIDGQTLGYPFVGVISNGHELPFLTISGGVWESGGGPKLPLVSRNVLDATQWIAPVPSSELMPRLVELSQSGSGTTPPVISTTRALTTTPDLTEAHGVDISGLLSAAGTGLVWAGVSGGESLPFSARRPMLGPRSSIIQVTNLGISVKDSAASTLVFVTRLDNALPVADAHVSIVNDANRVLWTGTTNRDGVARAPALDLRPPRARPGPLFIVTAEKDGDVGYVGADWGSTVNPYRFSVSYRAGAGAVLRGAVFSDRGAYRQGEDVHVKAVLRHDATDGASPLEPGTKLDVRVTDSRSREVDHRVAVANRWSSIDWTWHVPADAALGSYTVTINADPAALRATEAAPVNYNYNSRDIVRGTFLVAAYRRPDFRVDATMTADPPVLGETLHGVIDAKFLFGKALESQPVRWQVFRNAVTKVPDAIREKYQESTYGFGYMPDLSAARNTEVANKNETLDTNGHVDVRIETKADVDYAFSYLLSGDVTSVSAQHIANSAQMVVHPAAVYVGLKRPAMFVNVTQPAKTEIVVSDLGASLVADVPVTVSLAREEWFYGPRPNVGGRGGGTPVTDWQRKETPAGEWTVRSASTPVPLDIPLKDGGSYVLHATAVDASGRHTRTDVRFYGIGGGAASWRMDGNKITIVPEHETWKPGESAKVMIQSPWERATALVTVEREGVRRYQQVNISSTQDTVEVPITAGDVPNVFVSVLLVKGRTADALAPDGTDAGQPAFRVGYTMLTIDDESKRLNVSVSSDRDEYLPHAPAKVSVVVRDAGGKPASAEVALWAVDYGLLSLTNYTTPDIVKAIYARRDLQVLTEDTRERMISRRAFVKDDGSALGGGAGGGRGGGGNASGEQVGLSVYGASSNVQWNLEGGSVTDLASNRDPWAMNFDSFEQIPGAGPGPGFAFRKDFRPVVFWLGSTSTDLNGRATKDVTLPDSLTTYRIMAVADQAELFGSGEHEIAVTKPLTLLPAFPRFLSRGDRAVFGATVTNGSSTSGDAVVTVRSLDGTALGFEAAAVKTIHLAAGETQAVRFDAIARSIAPVRVQMTVKLGDETDAFETTLPVTMPSRLETVAAYGDTTSKAIEKLMLPAGAVPGAGGLTINLASTALVGLGESVRYINEYPYECAEAKASRALALVLTADLGGAFTLPGVKPETARANAASALDALYGFQCPDGGITFWPGQCQATSAYLTAYVLDVWRTSRDLKMTIDQGAINRALDYLQRQQRQQPPEVQWWPAWAASQAYAAKVLTAFGRSAGPDATRLYALAERMPVFALSYLADAMAGSGERGPRYQDVVRRLSNALRIEADRAHVEEMDDDSLAWLWNSNVRATAVVLEGLSRRQDEGTLAAPMARWLLASRTNGRWGTTYENATALAALVSYYRAFESDVPQMTVAVKLGTTTVGTVSFAGRSTTSHEFRIPMTELAKTLAGDSRDLEVARTGTGRVYYSTRLRYLAPEPPDPADRGMHIDRRFALFAPGGGASPAATTFNVGDVIRVTVTVNLPAEGKFIALDDRLPAGFEPIDESLSTTALDLAREATTNGPNQTFVAWWRRGGFDHVEKLDDRVLAFATRLSAGRHEFTYLVRATTAGSFTAAGAKGEAMYAPEVTGRSTAAVVTIK
ncbi:MAG TPA: MG2 domain-containing protein [Vicinamibacterales bacterium]|nr:MG2 domain-containing protein [Vicinamibacterales bacterium]